VAAADPAVGEDPVVEEYLLLAEVEVGDLKRRRKRKQTSVWRLLSHRCHWGSK
jgi:hypothetical protein